LKPANILLCKKKDHLKGDRIDHYKLKLADFNSSEFKYEDEEASIRMNKTEIIQGTQVYCSPTQMSGGKDPTGDLFSIGVILFRLLVGGPPDHRGVQENIFLQWVAEQLTLLHIPEDCIDLICKLMRYKSENRMTWNEFYAHPFLDFRHVSLDYCNAILEHIHNEKSNSNHSKTVTIDVNSPKKSPTLQLPSLQQENLNDLSNLLSKIRKAKEESQMQTKK